jgi:hypothetical protein
MSESSELKVLQAMRLKGRVDEATVVATVDEDPATAVATIADLIEAGLVIAGRTLKISPDGRARLEELLARERSGIDAAAVAAAYDDFRGVNADFKGLVVDWQSKDGEPNIHEDADYDAAVLARLDGVHQHVVPIITAAAAQPTLTNWLRRWPRSAQAKRCGSPGRSSTPTTRCGLNCTKN